VMYPRMKNLAEIFRIRLGDVEKLIRRVPRYLKSFVERNLVIPPYETRKEIADAILPPELEGCNFIVDGTDTRCWLRRERGEQRKKWWSFKFKRPAFRTQMVITHDGCWVWASDPIAASVHDKTAFELSDFRMYLRENERVLADKGYQGLDWCVCPQKNPQRGQLSNAQQISNRLINRFRNLIEQRFGVLKNRYGILRETYRHDKQFYGAYLRIILALSNLTLKSPTDRPSFRIFLSSLPAEALWSRVMEDSFEEILDSEEVSDDSEDLSWNEEK